jgi:TolA-binding protein
VGAVTYLQGQRSREADQAFTEAYEVYRTPIATDRPGEATPGGGPTGGGEERLKKAAAAFDGVERRFPTQPVAGRARYYGALCRIELGRYDEAEKALNETLARPAGPGVETAVARLALADLYFRRGDLNKAAEAYRQFASDSSLSYPRDYALMRLGTILEDAGKVAEATASYRRINEEFPTSVYAPEARRRADYLQTLVQG